MRHATTMVGMLAATALAAGCLGVPAPTAADLEALEQDRADVQGVLASFAQALKDRDPEAFQALLAPHVRPEEAAQLKRKFALACLMAFYEDYSPELAEPVRSLAWEEWNRAVLTVNIPYADRYRITTVDTFRLEYADGRWYLVGLELKPVAADEPLNPPDEVKVLLRDSAGELLEMLSTGRYMEVYYAIPSTSRVRYIELTWWQRVRGAIPQAVDILNELRRVTQDFNVLTWPRADEAVFVGLVGGAIGVHYDVPYVWPNGGITTPDLLRVQFIFLPSGEGWTFYQLRLIAAGIPWSR